MKKTVLRKYAALIARCGVNIQKGQDVLIRAELDQPEFVAILVDECYKAGARKVIVDWTHQPLEKLHVRHRSVKALCTVEDFEVAKFRYYEEKLPCRIVLVSEDPDGLNGINRGKMQKMQQARHRVLKPYLDAIEGKHQWCVAAVPGAVWAKKLFPELTRRQAVERLWEVILKIARVDDDPIAAWEAHNTDLKSRCDYLNSLGIRELIYHASNGTDLRVGMMEQGRFCGGGETSLKGVYFNPNIPTEECFVTPMRGEAEGIVYSTKPLSYQGQLIENFSIRFEGGRAVEVHAEKNEELLRTMISMDEGAAYLGECALVPFTSPINESGILFYNTLFDENACCHLALGMGYIDTVQDYGSYSLEELRKMGVNDSMIHEDFMIGTNDLSIDARCADGKVVPIFRDGTWAF